MGCASSAPALVPQEGGVAPLVEAAMSNGFNLVLSVNQEKPSNDQSEELGSIAGTAMFGAARIPFSLVSRFTTADGETVVTCKRSAWPHGNGLPGAGIRPTASVSFFDGQGHMAACKIKSYLLEQVSTRGRPLSAPGVLDGCKILS